MSLPRTRVFESRIVKLILAFVQERKPTNVFVQERSGNLKKKWNQAPIIDTSHLYRRVWSLFCVSPRRTDPSSFTMHPMLPMLLSMRRKNSWGRASEACTSYPSFQPKSVVPKSDTFSSFFKTFFNLLNYNSMQNFCSLWRIAKLQLHYTLVKFPHSPPLTLGTTNLIHDFRNCFNSYDE